MNEWIAYVGARFSIRNVFPARGRTQQKHKNKTNELENGEDGDEQKMHETKNQSLGQRLLRRNGLLAGFLSLEN